MKQIILVLTATTALLLAACGQQEETAQSAPPASPTESAAPQATAAAPEAPANAAGKKAYGMTCAMCHASGAAGAPIPGNKEEWAPRIAQGMDVLYKHAIEGYTGEKGMMPAKGGNPSLSDENTKAAVDYMVELSR